MANYIYKLSVSLFIMLFIPAYASDKTFVSTSPSMTEIMYAIGAKDALKAVSTKCTYPNEAKEKPVIGDTYFVNMEMLLKIRPDYFLAPDSAEFMLKKISGFGIKPLCFKYKDIDEVYKNILELGKLTGKENNSKELVSFMKTKILKANKHANKKNLYIVQEEPIITPAKKSFINDIVLKSGNTLVTGNIDSYYPVVSEEFLINQKPDIIVLDYYCKESPRIRKLFPNTKFIKMKEIESDIIDRPGPRIWMAVEFFANLPF